MNATLQSKLLKGSVFLLALASLAGCATQSPSDISPTPTPTPSSSPSSATTIVYSNAPYGFTFTLPPSWAGYTIVNSSWQGLSIATGAQVESGPLLSIRHPLWTAAKNRQDIPIMVLSITQWNNLTAGKFHIGAAPIPPSELGRNAKYVFALPARYNYAFPEGYQEVDQILQGKPLHTN